MHASPINLACGLTKRVTPNKWALLFLLASMPKAQYPKAQRGGGRQQHTTTNALRTRGRECAPSPAITSEWRAICLLDLVSASGFGRSRKGGGFKPLASLLASNDEGLAHLDLQLGNQT